MTFEALMAGFIIGMSIGGWAGWFFTREWFREQLVKHGYAKYHFLTGQWTFVDDLIEDIKNDHSSVGRRVSR